MTSVIVSGARTPMGKLLGNLKDLPATALGAAAIKAALERSGVTPEQVQYVIMGQVLQAGAGQIPARQAAVAAGIPMTVPALTINKVCLSGLDAIALADQLIRAGEFDIIVAGGMESMTNAPGLLMGQRGGYKYGDIVVKDHSALDGLTDAFDQISMGESTDHFNVKYGIGREEQDAFGAASHQKAALAQRNGHFAEEITPISLPQRKGDPIVISQDEGIRPDTTTATLAKLRPAFGVDGTITAGTSSPISDGAAAVVVMSKAKAQELGLTWLAEIGAHGNVAGPDDSLHAQPANAIRHALGKAGMTVDDLDVIEINEAFAAVGIESTRQLAIDPERVNVNGGAIALGHPIGASGARLVLSLAMELKRRGGGTGAAALCGGGGQGDALIIRVPLSHPHRRSVGNVSVVPLEFAATVVGGQPATEEVDGFSGFLFGFAASEDGLGGCLIVQRADDPKPEWQPYCLVWGMAEGTTYGGVHKVEVEPGEVVFELSRHNAAELGTPRVFRIAFPPASTEVVRAGLARALGAGIVR